jgi:hypothetical protein
MDGDKPTQGFEVPGLRGVEHRPAPEDATRFADCDKFAPERRGRELLSLALGYSRAAEIFDPFSCEK